MNIRFCLPLFLIPLLFGCNPAPKHHNNITKIVLARGGCYGTCPRDVMVIDSTLTCYYQGISNTSHEGLYTGKIKPELWDSINIKLEEIRFSELDSAYLGTIDDEAMAIRIYHDGKIKYIRSQSSSLPESIYNVFSWLGETSEKIKLEPATSIEGFDFYISTSEPVRKISIEELQKQK